MHCGGFRPTQKLRSPKIFHIMKQQRLHQLTSFVGLGTVTSIVDHNKECTSFMILIELFDYVFGLVLGSDIQTTGCCMLFRRLHQMLQYHVRAVKRCRIRAVRQYHQYLLCRSAFIKKQFSAFLLTFRPE